MALIKKILLVCLITSSIISFGNTQNPESKIKTVFVFNFTKYIQWTDQGNEFVIGVLGESADTFKALQTMANQKTVSGKKIVVKKITNPSEYSACNILYITGDKSKMLSAVKAKNLKNTLVVTEKEGMAEKGSGINFVKKEGKLRFELNEKELERCGLKVSSQLKGLAILV